MPDEPAPGSRRRVRRGSVLPPLTPAEPAEEPAAEAADEEAPKPKRRTRKKPTDAETAAAERLAQLDRLPDGVDVAEQGRRGRRSKDGDLRVHVDV